MFDPLLYCTLLSRICSVLASGKFRYFSDRSGLHPDTNLRALLEQDLCEQPSLSTSRCGTTAHSYICQNVHKSVAIKTAPITSPVRLEWDHRQATTKMSLCINFFTLVTTALKHLSWHDKMYCRKMYCISNQWTDSLTCNEKWSKVSYSMIYCRSYQSR